MGRTRDVAVSACKLAHKLLTCVRAACRIADQAARALPRHRHRASLQGVPSAPSADWLSSAGSRQLYRHRALLDVQNPRGRVHTRQQQRSFTSTAVAGPSSLLRAVTVSRVVRHTLPHCNAHRGAAGHEVSHVPHHAAHASSPPTLSRTHDRVCAGAAALSAHPPFPLCRNGLCDTIS